MKDTKYIIADNVKLYRKKKNLTQFERKRFIVGILTTRATVLNSVALVCSFYNYLED